MDAWMVPAVLWALSALILWSPHWAGRTEARHDQALLLTVLIAATLVANDGPLAYAAAAAMGLLHAWRSRALSSTSTVAFTASALLVAGAGAALAVGEGAVAFGASLLAIALRAGLLPLHAGVVPLAERLPSLQTQQLATLIALVVAHLRFANPTPLAYDLAPYLVRYGAVMTLLPALMALVQRDLRGFFRSATLMHGGMLFAAIGAAGRGHQTAALMVVITTAAAMGGLGVLVTSLEERAGPVSLDGPGGRAEPFPRLAAAFALFGAAGVAMPGTAGFIADDLLLHALWEESVGGTVVVLMGSAVLAIATLQAWSRIFLGKAATSLAPDLAFRERSVVAALVLLLVWLGVAPGVLLTPTEGFLGGAEHMLDR